MKGRKPKLKPPVIVGSGKLPEPPGWLDNVARQEWDRILPEVSAAYVITPMDAVILASYCAAFAKWRQCEDRVRKEGIIVGGKIHPLERHALYLLQEVRRIAGEFGLSPAARTRLPAKPQADELDDF
jgi:P27 family predicted phage terminase small subunit